MLPPPICSGSSCPPSPALAEHWEPLAVPPLSCRVPNPAQPRGGGDGTAAGTQEGPPCPLSLAGVSQCHGVPDPPPPPSSPPPYWGSRESLLSPPLHGDTPSVAAAGGHGLLPCLSFPIARADGVQLMGGIIWAPPTPPPSAMGTYGVWRSKGLGASRSGGGPKMMPPPNFLVPNRAGRCFGV